MRTFSWSGGELEEGIVMRRSSQNNYYTPLGDGDTPGPHHMVTLHRDNPPEVRGGRVYEAFPYWVRPRNGDAFLVLARTHARHAASRSVVIRVSTHADVTYGGRGFWRQVDGPTDTLLTGITYYKDFNGRNAVASEGLVRLAPGAVLRVRPEGSDDHWAVVNDGEWVLSERWEVYAARSAPHDRNAFTVMSHE